MNDDKFDQQLKDKYETLNYKAEMSRIVKDLVKGLPDTIQPIMENKHLNYIFGLESRKKPVAGSVWNKVSCFPNSYSYGQLKKSQSSVTSQGQMAGAPGMTH